MPGQETITGEVFCVDYLFLLTLLHMSKCLCNGRRQEHGPAMETANLECRFCDVL
jgi:hypothetical protein